MCLHSKIIKNPKYKPNIKNGGKPPYLADIRVAAVPIGCGECIECRQQKATQWKIRLQEDIKEHTNGKFVTLTFSNESLDNIIKLLPNSLTGYKLDNAIAIHAVRKFTESYRGKYGKTLRHWLVTELGQNNSERLHIHGIIWTDEPKKTIEKIWGYGNMGWQMTWEQEKNYVNMNTIGYIVKYLSKIDPKHPGYNSIILASNGIGKHYTNHYASKINAYTGATTNDKYKDVSGTNLNLPVYYRNKLYTDEQKEQLWISKLDKQIRWVRGIKIDVSKGYKRFLAVLEEAQRENKNLGYGKGYRPIDLIEYEETMRTLARKRQGRIIE